MGGGASRAMRTRLLSEVVSGQLEAWRVHEKPCQRSSGLPQVATYLISSVFRYPFPHFREANHISGVFRYLFPYHI